jgi:P-type Cu+ transporter
MASMLVLTTKKILTERGINMKTTDELPKQENLETKDDSDDCLTSCLSSTAKKESEEEVVEEEEEELDTSKAKLLIILGISLTIPLVIIEIFYDYGSSSLIDYILIALASPVQFILGKSFYVRFYMGLRKKRVFTVSTLVILSTTVAYSYSIIAIITGQDIRFFEASASVLTIFTIGEYLESRVLRTTSESIKKLFTLKPKRAVVIRNRIINEKEEEETRSDD